MLAPMRTRAALLGALLATGGLCSASAGAAGPYGELIAHGSLPPTASSPTTFHRVRAARVFWLLVNQPAGERLQINWSIRCTDASRREVGGASGNATIAGGHWAKQVRADWIKHAVLCSGAVRGTAAKNDVFVRIYESGT